MDLIPYFPAKSEQNSGLGITRLGIDSALELDQRPEVEFSCPFVIFDPGF